MKNWIMRSDFFDRLAKGDTGIKKNIESGDIDINSIDDERNSLLMTALRKKKSDEENINWQKQESSQIKVIKDLLKLEGTRINTKNVHGETALILAANNPALVPKTIKELLYIKDIDVNARDNQGNTALILAISAGNIDTAEVLLNQGNIDVQTKNNNKNDAMAATWYFFCTIRHGDAHTKKREIGKYNKIVGIIQTKGGQPVSFFKRMKMLFSINFSYYEL